MRKAYDLDHLLKKNLFGCVVIPEGNRAVVERLGRFHSVLEPGFRILVPGLDRIAFYFPTHQVSLDTKEQEMLTEDKILVRVTSRIHIAVTDPKMAGYVAKTPFMRAIFDAETSLQNSVANYSLKQLLEQRPEIEETREKTKAYGVECFHHEIIDIKLPEFFQKAVAQHILALQESKAKLLQAETDAKCLEIIEKAIEENPAAASSILTVQALGIVGKSVEESLRHIREKKKKT